MIGTFCLVIVAQASKLHYLHPTSLFFWFPALRKQKIRHPKIFGYWQPDLQVSAET